MIIIILLHFIDNIDGIRSRINMVYCHWEREIRTERETDRESARKMALPIDFFIYIHRDILCHFLIWVGVGEKKRIFLSFTRISKKKEEINKHTLDSERDDTAHSCIDITKKTSMTRYIHTKKTYTQKQYNYILIHCHSSISLPSFCSSLLALIWSTIDQIFFSSFSSRSCSGKKKEKAITLTKYAS